MNMRILIAGTALFALFATSALPQQAALKDQLVGSWTLATADAFGANPKGTLMFDASGHFSAILVVANLPRYAANSRTQGTAEEYNATVKGSLMFFGTYAVSGTDLNMRIEGSNFPNWEGTSQKRTNVSVAGDELKYTQPLPSGGGGATVVIWKRAK
jgi:Lipocalin-like domain